MTYDKIALVLAFLFVLIAIQMFIRIKLARNSSIKSQVSKITLKARLGLSRNERVDVIQIDGKDLAIVFSRNSTPSIIDLQTTVHSDANEAVS
jgi:flagellar biogenesis protein FliO